MESTRYDAGQEEVREALAGLLRQAERCVLAGLAPHAESVLTQVWSAAVEAHPDLASTAAWGLAWLQVSNQRFIQAAEWFRRVDGAAELQRLWPFAQQIMVAHCTAQAGAIAPCPPAAGPGLPPLTISSLGYFRVARDAETLPRCSARKAITLFRYLLTRSERSAHREELAGVIWPELSQRSAAHSLHIAVAALRRHLDPPAAGGRSYIHFDTGHYRIDPEVGLEDDAARFQRLCAEGSGALQQRDLAGARQALAAAVACYQGDYALDECDFPWALAERERLLVAYLTALDQLGRVCIELGAFTEAIDAYLLLLARDSYREDAYIQLMQCYMRSGRRVDALRQYEQCAAILKQDLGLEPMSELQSFYESIRRVDKPD